MTSNNPSEIASQMLVELNGPALTAPRALLVYLDRNGNLDHQPVRQGQSVLSLDELQDHLNAQPVSDAFLIELRDFCAGRLAALDEARRTRGFVTPHPTESRSWNINHVQAFQPVTIGGAQ